MKIKLTFKDTIEFELDNDIAQEDICEAVCDYVFENVEADCIDYEYEVISDDNVSETESHDS